MQSSIRAAALALIAVGARQSLPARRYCPRPRRRAAPATQRIGGTWDLTWKTRRGETRKGSMVVEQRGTPARSPRSTTGAAPPPPARSGLRLHAARKPAGASLHGHRPGPGPKDDRRVEALALERRFTGVAAAAGAGRGAGLERLRAAAAPLAADEEVDRDRIALVRHAVRAARLGAGPELEAPAAERAGPDAAAGRRVKRVQTRVPFWSSGWE